MTETTAQPGWWIDPGTPGLGRLDPHTIRARYRSEKAALQASDEWRISLDGEWRFMLVGRPEAAPAGFAAPDLADGDWDTIPVPSNWTLHADDIPHYTNVRMPWVHEPPKVPEHNPTGLYRTSFDLPSFATGDRVVVHFGGAESALAVWANGAFVGFHKDSRLPGEFDITEHVSPGTNHIAAMVVRWSDGSWIEDQDHWWMAGIHRSVYVYTTPAAHLRDVVIDAVLNADLTSATLTVNTPVDFPAAPEAGWTIDVRFPDGEFGTSSAPVKIPSLTANAEHMDSVTFHGTRARAVIELAAVRPWSAENPERYLILVALLDPTGAEVEVIPARIGFTRTEIANRQLLLNGQPLLIRGVNRHDHHPERGKAVTAEDITEDLYAIKRYGFNAVRTAHYPNDPHLLDVCDEIGLYVIDEANIECHARARHLLHEPHYEVAVLDRIRRMVRRDRNHPSIFAWSLGNESGYAPVHDAAAAWVRGTDPHRLVHYEGPMWTFPWSTTPDQGERATDLVCPMYPSLDTLREWASIDDKRPLIMCEFSHAMGNSNGSLSDYWDLIESTDGLQGGFIWDWRDQGLSAISADGTPYWAFGGHYGDDPNDGNFNCNGIVGSDLRPHPGLWEHVHLARPVDVELSPDGAVVIRNRRSFTDLSDLAARVEVIVGEAVVHDSDLPLPTVGPGKAVELTLPELKKATEQAEAAGRRALLTVYFQAADETPWQPIDTLVAAVQVALHTPATPARPADLEATSGHPPLTASVDERTGAISILENGSPLLIRPIELCLWRAPLDNDGVKGLATDPGSGTPDTPRRRWQQLGLHELTVASVHAETVGDELIVRSDHVGTDRSLVVRHRATVTRLPVGCHVSHEITIPEGVDDLPRVGVRFSLAESLTKLAWFGLGPHESYPDRRRSTRFGTWETAVGDQYEPFPVPQEHGHHLETSWFQLRAGSGRSLAVHLDHPCGFSALHHHVDDLSAAMSLADLTASPGTHVHIDAGIRGLGTGSCGPDALDQYQLKAGVFRFGYTMLTTAGAA